MTPNWYKIPEISFETFLTAIYPIFQSTIRKQTRQYIVQTDVFMKTILMSMNNWALTVKYFIYKY